MSQYQPERGNLVEQAGYHHAQQADYGVSTPYFKVEDDAGAITTIKGLDALDYLTALKVQRKNGTEYEDRFFSSRRRHTRLQGDWSSDVCSSDLPMSLLLWGCTFGHNEARLQALQADFVQIGRASCRERV